jgi:hypothetical protein
VTNKNQVKGDNYNTMWQYTIDNFRWGEYKGWSILVFTEIENH